MTDQPRRATLAPAVIYKDPDAALDWLENAFGFERSMVITDADGNLSHAEMTVGECFLMVGAEWAGHVASPASVGGKNTQSVHVHLHEDDIESHHDRAVAAGAQIVREPEDQFYGDRVYAAKDPEGHIWTFSQTVRQISRKDAERASGLKIEGWI